MALTSRSNGSGLRRAAAGLGVPLILGYQKTKFRRSQIGGHPIRLLRETMDGSAFFLISKNRETNARHLINQIV
jgi:hypothetical protein